ncbi:GMC oxidoreductase [Streptomyces sp. NPDC006134]|uniref:GMC oxidoreductase n=1 Tax=Streptomyces sp. NPDC006134 TaxID=3154467 RepID=UPI0033E7391B
MSLPSATAYDLVVGGGPTGSAYVREVYEQHPTATILLLDAGPRLTGQPGTHVKNIPDPDGRARAQRASEGSGPAGRPGTRLLGSPELPAAALSTNVGGMGAHWTGACPRPGDGAIVPQSGVSWVPYTDAHPFHGQVMQLDASPVPLADGTGVEPGAVVGLGWFCAKDISPDDRVEFDDTAADACGLPALRIHYHYSDRDLAAIEQARKAVAEAGAAVGVPLDDSPHLLPAGSSLHYQGTTRMGPADDGTSVCDSHSRVWNTRGLWVAGNNVIPTATACNPTLTSVALAVRGARALLDHLDPTAGRSAPAARADKLPRAR